MVQPHQTRQKTFLHLCQLTAHPPKMSIVLLLSPAAAFLRGKPDPDIITDFEMLSAKGKKKMQMSREPGDV